MASPPERLLHQLNTLIPFLSNPESKKETVLLALNALERLPLTGEGLRDSSICCYVKDLCYHNRSSIREKANEVMTILAQVLFDWAENKPREVLEEHCELARFRLQQRILESLKHRPTTNSNSDPFGIPHIPNLPSPPADWIYSPITPSHASLPPSPDFRSPTPSPVRIYNSPPRAAAPVSSSFEYDHTSQSAEIDSYNHPSRRLRSVIVLPSAPAAPQPSSPSQNPHCDYSHYPPRRTTSGKFRSPSPPRPSKKSTSDQPAGRKSGADQNINTRDVSAIDQGGKRKRKHKRRSRKTRKLD